MNQPLLWMYSVLGTSVVKIQIINSNFNLNIYFQTTLNTSRTDDAEMRSIQEKVEPRRTENIEPSSRVSIETQTIGILRSEKPGLKDSPPSSMSPDTSGSMNESFNRAGSGRKLPLVPSKSNTLPSKKTEKKSPGNEDKEVTYDPMNNGKSKPAALRFWETMETDKLDFKYNTIHRMSGNRRILPQPPEKSVRSKSVERDNKMAAHSSFEESPRESFDTSPRMSRGSTRSSGGSGESNFFSRPGKIPPDGASLQEFINSINLKENFNINLSCLFQNFFQSLELTLLQSEGSELENQRTVEGFGEGKIREFGERRDGEGSSDKNSPTTSLIKGKHLIVLRSIIMNFGWAAKLSSAGSNPESPIES